MLENVPDDMSRDVLMMLLENISGSDENSYSLEIIWEFNRAVVTFNKPEGDCSQHTDVVNLKMISHIYEIKQNP